MFSYDKIGGKIKSLAKWTFIVETIAAIFGGIMLIYVAIHNSEGGFAVLGLLSAVCGPLIAWVGTWILYGFGEITDKVCSIERNTRGGSIKSEAQAEIDSERINKLERLRAQGLITEEEYQQALSKNNV